MSYLSDADYKLLHERVAQGKKILDGKWGSNDPETKEWVRLWFLLSDQLLSEMIRRGVFPYIPTTEELQVSIEAKIQNAREQMIAKGLIKKPREAKKRKPKESKHEELFVL